MVAQLYIESTVLNLVALSHILPVSLGPVPYRQGGAAVVMPTMMILELESQPAFSPPALLPPIARRLLLEEIRGRQT